MDKVTNLLDYRDNAIKENEGVLQAVNNLIAWFIDPQKLFDIYEEELVESRYNAIPEALSINVDRIRGIKWPPHLRSSVQHVLEKLHQIHAIMLQCKQIESNETIPEQLQETLRSECAAAIEVIWLGVAGLPIKYK